ncbi:MAG: methyl-accepting chemotaxis protein [Defluviitaleaceae bacterium]|nr:methyl-accepting chemotaxis protein [Defluviitaleaceae bacterium]
MNISKIIKIVIVVSALTAIANIISSEMAATSAGVAIGYYEEIYNLFSEHVGDDEQLAAEILAIRDVIGEYLADVGVFHNIGLLTTALLLLVSLGGMMYILRRFYPIRKLAKLVNDVSNGNFSVNTDRSKISKDEIGRLTLDVHNLIGTIKVIFDDLSRLSQEVDKGHLNARGDETAAKGEFETFVAGTNRIIENIISFLDALPYPVIVIDAQHKYSFFNKYSVNFGYHQESMLGKTILEGSPPEIGEALTNSIKRAEYTGEICKDIVSIMSPNGEELTFEQNIMPIKDAYGKASCFIIAPYDITQIGKSQKVAEKIANYQDFEAMDIERILQNGLAKGVLSFEYKPEPHDEDTRLAMESYARIDNALVISAGIIKSYVEETTMLLQELAEKNFGVEITRQYIGDFGPIKSSIEILTTSISSLISEIQGSSTQVEEFAGRISQSAQELKINVENQVSTINTMSETITRLMDKIQKNADDAENTNQLSKQVKNAAELGNNAMLDMSAAMEEVKQSSSEIARVVKIIEDIAFQTNLLALNASVEAARAGEHGKGFAVVAEEVRNLAGRSAAAAKETSDLIAESLHRVDKGVAMTQHTADALSSIVQFTTDMTENIANIAEASNSQAGEIGTILQNVESINQTTSNNSDVVQTNVYVVDELSSQASVLRQLVEQFKIKR